MHAYICDKKSHRIAIQDRLTIAGKAVAFFIPHIAGTTSFKASADQKRWQLKFFVGSPFEQELFVSFDPDDNEKKWVVGRACYLNNSANSEQNHKLLEEASMFLRNSKTLELDQGRELSSGRVLLADRGDFAYLSVDQNQFMRIVLCLALAISYKKVLYQCMGRLKDHVRASNNEGTISLYQDILRFNAADYFSLPVAVERHELFSAWGVLHDHYKLGQLSQELTQQLTGVAVLLQAAREREFALHNEQQRKIEEESRRNEDKKDKGRALVLTLAGVVLTATSLLSLVQITPKHFQEFGAGWATLLKGNQPASETSDGDPTKSKDMAVKKLNRKN